MGIIDEIRGNRKMQNSSHSFASYYKRATSPLVVLLFLSERQMYGYEISSEMSARSGGVYTMSVLYQVLYRLEEEGYIAPSEPEIIEGRARYYYHITEAGKAYLKQSLADYEKMDQFLKKLSADL